MKKIRLIHRQAGVYYHYQFIYLSKLTKTTTRCAGTNDCGQAASLHAFICLQEERDANPSQGSWLTGDRKRVVEHGMQNHDGRLEPPAGYRHGLRQRHSCKTGSEDNKSSPSDRRLWRKPCISTGLDVQKTSFLVNAAFCPRTVQLRYNPFPAYTPSRKPLML